MTNQNNISTLEDIMKSIKIFVTIGLAGLFFAPLSFLAAQQSYWDNHNFKKDNRLNFQPNFRENQGFRAELNRSGFLVSNIIDEENENVEADKRTGRNLNFMRGRMSGSGGRNLDIFSRFRGQRVINLSEEQKNRIEGILKDDRNKQIDLQAELKKAQIAFREAITDKNQSENSAKSAFNKAADAEKRIREIQVDNQLAIRNVLTDEQWEKIGKLRKLGTLEKIRDFRQGENTAPQNQWGTGQQMRNRNRGSFSRNRMTPQPPVQNNERLDSLKNRLRNYQKNIKQYQQRLKDRIQNRIRTNKETYLILEKIF